MLIHWRTDPVLLRAGPLAISRYACWSSARLWSASACSVASARRTASTSPAPMVVALPARGSRSGGAPGRCSRLRPGVLPRPSARDPQGPGRRLGESRRRGRTACGTRGRGAPASAAAPAKLDCRLHRKPCGDRRGHEPAREFPRRRDRRDSRRWALGRCSRRSMPCRATPTNSRRPSRTQRSRSGCGPCTGGNG